MKWFILFILFICIIFLYNEKENFVVLYQTPIPIVSTDPIYKSMIQYNVPAASVEEDLRYFNNASHILFGLERIPTTI